MEELARAERQMERLKEAGANARPGTPRWHQIRAARERLGELIRTLRQRLNVGGVLGQCLAVLGVADLVSVAVTAAREGHSFAEELNILAEADPAEAAERGVHTEISGLGPLCLVIDNQVY